MNVITAYKLRNGPPLMWQPHDGPLYILLHLLHACFMYTPPVTNSFSSAFDYPPFIINSEDINLNRAGCVAISRSVALSGVHFTSWTLLSLLSSDNICHTIMWKQLTLSCKLGKSYNIFFSNYKINIFRLGVLLDTRSWLTEHVYNKIINNNVGEKMSFIFLNPMQL